MGAAHLLWPVGRHIRFERNSAVELASTHCASFSGLHALLHRHRDVWNTSKHYCDLEPRSPARAGFGSKPHALGAWTNVHLGSSHSGYPH